LDVNAIGLDFDANTFSSTRRMIEFSSRDVFQILDYRLHIDVQSLSRLSQRQTVLP
jgi:hypothetical protein